MSKRLIYEEDAIDAVAEGLKRTFVEYRDVAEKMLNKVPSVQPESSEYEELDFVKEHERIPVTLTVQPQKQATTYPVDGEPLDCISRQEAILAIERNAYRREDINETEKVILWVLDIIKWLPSVQPQSWIPVTEALPDVRRWVLCQCRANIIDVLRLTDDGSWYLKPNEIYMSGFVLAWMPLPEPYAERGQE